MRIEMQTTMSRKGQDKLECHNVKNANNPHLKSKYADLNSILEVIKEPLKESGLSITHHCKNVDGSFSVVTTLAFSSSKETIDSEFPVFGNKPQEI